MNIQRWKNKFAEYKNVQSASPSRGMAHHHTPIVVNNTKDIVMFDELKKYKETDHFFFETKDNLSSVCNAPKEKGGIYIVNALCKGNIDLVYIGSSGKVLQNGLFKTRKGGLFDRLVNGKQFGDPRKVSWKEKMKSDNIDALDVYWYVTFNNGYKDILLVVEGLIIQKYFDINESLPPWNIEF